jgi:hypothetical protein
VQDRLGIKERAALLALMAEAAEVSNADLKRRLGFALDGAARRKLNDLKLVTSRRKGNAPFDHELTEMGWAWCAKEMSAATPQRAGSAGGALYAVLAALNRYMKRTDLRLSDIFGRETTSGRPEAPAPEIQARIRAAYKSLVKGPTDWVSLTKLRQLLGDISKTDVDAALQQMTRNRQVNLVPDSNQKTLTSEDRESAVQIGGEYKHLISMDNARLNRKG